MHTPIFVHVLSREITKRGKKCTIMDLEIAADIKITTTRV